MPIFSQDLYIDAGADFVFTTPPYVIAGVIQNFTGTSCRFNIRQSPSDPNPTLALTSTPGANGSVVQNGTAGTSTLDITKAATSSIPYANGPLQYAWYVDTPGSPGTTLELQSGRIFINPGI